MNWIGHTDKEWSILVHAWSTGIKSSEILPRIRQDFGVEVQEDEWHVFCQLMDMQMKRDLGSTI